MSGVFEEKYFCAVNSGTGFISYYGDLTKRAERVFIIKGGPGTGKSSFMRRISKEAEKGGCKVQYFYCSSDPTSLDAVLIDDGTLFLDGTAPHNAELELAGAKDNLIDLGAFWDCSELIGQKETIQNLTSEKKKAFSQAYHCLAAAKEVTLARDASLLSCLYREKLSAAAERALLKVKKGKGFEKKEIVTNSFGMKGCVYFDTLERLANERISVSDTLGSAHLFLEQIIYEAKKKKLSVTVSKNPLIPERYDAVLINGIGRLYFAANGGEKTVNMLRFFDPVALKEIKAEQKRLQNLIRSLTGSAITAFEKASLYHFKLENIYGKAMDFAMKEEFTDNFLSEMFT